MREDAASLDRLHDLVLPPEIPWWPPAIGWYALLVVVLVFLLFLGYQTWKSWRSNAYRRAAQRKLQTAENAAAIAAILRRTALAIAPRHAIASRSGDQWVRWVADRATDPVPERIAHLLSLGPYREHVEDSELQAFRDFARRWIANHRRISAK